MMFRLK